MKAVRFHSFGGPEVLTYEDAPRPEPQDGELLIRVHAAGVNPADWKIRSGQAWPSLLQDYFPLISGLDVSGVVEAVGSRVTGYGTGDAVYGFIGVLEAKGRGSYAEYVTCPASFVARKPESLDHVHAASLPVAALTAWQALFDAAHLSPGQGEDGPNTGSGRAAPWGHDGAAHAQRDTAAERRRIANGPHTRVRLAVAFHESRKHLPIVTLKRVA